MSEESKGTVTYEDTEYVVDDLPERGQALVGLVASVREEASGLQARLAVLQAAEITFSKELEEILNAPEQENIEGID